MIARVARADGPAGSRERGKQRRIERILDAALELLREDPDENLTVERTAARADDGIQPRWQPRATVECSGR
jgi:AcrR family transcriptional regulator